MQAIKRVRLGDCKNRDVIRYKGEICTVYHKEDIHTVRVDGEYIECFGITSRINHKIHCDRYVDLIRIDVLTNQHYDPPTANVFADFLEENGYIEAAKLLRSEFPLLIVEKVTND